MNSLTKLYLQVIAIAFALSGLNSLGLSLKNISISASHNLSLSEKDSFQSYEFDKMRWHYQMIPYQNGKSCFVRLSYKFIEDLLIKFDLEESKEVLDEHKRDEFVIYVSPGLPLNVIDIFLDEPVFTSRVCKKEPIDIFGLHNIQKIIAQWGFDEEIFTALLQTPIALSSYTVGDYVNFYHDIYKDLWGIKNFNSTCFDEQIRMEISLDSEYDEKNFQTEMVREVVDDVYSDFETFFTLGQIDFIQSKAENDETLFDDLMKNISSVVGFLSKKLMDLIEDPTTRKQILKNRFDSLKNYNHIIAPILESDIFVPMLVYMKVFSERGVIKDMFQWSGERANEESGPVLVSSANLKNNFIESMLHLNPEMATQSNNEFNALMIETYMKIRKEYSKWLNEKFSGDAELIKEALDWFDDYTSEEREIHIKLSFTDYNLMQKMNRYIDQCLTKFSQQNYLTMTRFYRDESLNLDSLSRLFFENRQISSKTLPILIGHLFEIR